MAEPSDGMYSDADEDATYGNDVLSLLASPAKTRSRGTTTSQEVHVGVVVQDDSPSGPLKKRNAKKRNKLPPPILARLSETPPMKQSKNSLPSLSAKNQDDRDDGLIDTDSNDDESSGEERVGTKNKERPNRFAKYSRSKRLGRWGKTETVKRSATDSKRGGRKQVGETCTRAAARQDERVARKQVNESRKPSATDVKRGGRTQARKRSPNETDHVGMEMNKTHCVGDETDKTLSWPPRKVENVKQVNGNSPATLATKVNSGVRNDAMQQQTRAHFEAMVGPPEQLSTGSNGSNQRIAPNFGNVQRYASVRGSKSNSRRTSPRKSFSLVSKVKDVEETPFHAAKASPGAPSRNVVANGSDAVFAKANGDASSDMANTYTVVVETVDEIDPAEVQSEFQMPISNEGDNQESAAMEAQAFIELDTVKEADALPVGTSADGTDMVGASSLSKAPAASGPLVIPDAEASKKFANDKDVDVDLAPYTSEMNQNDFHTSPQPLEQRELQPLSLAFEKDEASYKKRRTRQGSVRGDATMPDSRLQQQAQAMMSAQGFDTERDKDAPPLARRITRVPEETVPVRAQIPKVYEEETAFLHFNPPFPEEGKHIPEAVATKELGGLPIPDDPDESKFPNTGKCKWSFDKDTRVLLADFRQENGKVELIEEDERFLYEMMERDDITCISDGLANHIDPKSYDPNTLFNAAGDEFFHKHRRFDKMKRQEFEALGETHVTCKYKEKDVSLAMQVKDFSRYVGMHEAALKAEAEGKADAVETKFEFKDQSGTVHTIEDVRNTVLYMIDFDVIKLLPKLYEAIQNDFLLPGILPGGVHCMMNAINVNGRPFMGPNAYLTPPGSFTQVHQDGHGTVDSGHLCLTGYNEVVMLRRLPERHKINALALLRGEGGGEKYDGLYGLPHDEGGPEKPDWPTAKAIEECKKKGYCPSVFILMPGQLVHINKGRLHAFRKLWPEYLVEIDCHSFLRRDLLDKLKAKGIDRMTPEEFLCFSIAWDWMYRGVTVEGINRETTAILECSTLNRLHNRQSLAIPELAILRMAGSLTPLETYQPVAVSRLFESEAVRNSYPPMKRILRGILPSLRYIVQQQVDALEMAKDASHQEGASLSIEETPNSWQDPQTFSLDPYGNSDFFCKLCSKELSNIYMHCDGCENLIQKDFNICVDCHHEERYKTFVQMHPHSNKRRSLLNHTGNMKYNRSDRCACKNGPRCKDCGYCVGCSCKCHERFTVMTRFYGPEAMKSLERRVENVAYEANDDQKDVADGLLRDKTVISRLDAATKPLRGLPVRKFAVSLVDETEPSSASASMKQQAKRSSKNRTGGGKGQNTSGSGRQSKAKRAKGLTATTSVGGHASVKEAREIRAAARKLKSEKGRVSQKVAPGSQSATRTRKASDTEGVAPLHAERPTKRAKSMGTTSSLGVAEESSVVQTTAPKKARKPCGPASVYNDKNCEATVRAILQLFNVADRPDNLRPSADRVSRPASRDDLSDSALAFTEPKGRFPFVDRGCAMECFGLSGHISLREFIEKARELNQRTPASMMKLLPESAKPLITEDGARHLFRNFSDTEVINGTLKVGTGKPSIYFSAREVAIMLYCLLLESGNVRNAYKKSWELMPYRRETNFRHIMFPLSRCLSDICEAYKTHLEQTVGLLFELERGESVESATGEATFTEGRDIRTAAMGPLAPKSPVNTEMASTGGANLKEAPASRSPQELSSAPVEMTTRRDQDAVAKHQLDSYDALETALANGGNVSM